ncbi:hypothetical protein [uncultured Deefgea sp.]|uniref:hypothetical protein n=1 Tax=uncultured Deefgea sp. TaxID=1304914 RepID=UPI002599113D|nr:hypothetical protein [uncultured Deefgea sp.]
MAFPHSPGVRDVVETTTWPTPDEGALSDERRSLYFARKKAIELYFSGVPFEQIKQLTALGKRQIYRLIHERCLEIHSDGQVYGWRGLLPYFRINSYTRHTNIHVNQFGYGAVGALQSLLNYHPDLREAFNTRIKDVSSGNKLKGIKLSRMKLCQWILDKLRELGYESRKEWPFNTASLGYSSICRYIKNLLADNPRALANASGGPDLIKKLKTGDGTNRPTLRFMQRVEMDAHKLDGRFCVSIPLMGGGYQEKIIHRLWVIVILEVVSRVVIGYYLSIRREVSQDDVLRAIKRGLSNWTLREVSFCDTPYLPNAGLLSTLGANFVGLCWDECSVDGALAETCQRVRTELTETAGAVLLEPNSSFSKRRSKDDRPFIETYFRNLAGGAFQRLSNTTGAKPQDKKGRQPEEVAITSRFQFEYAEELLDVLIANYNATPHHGINNRTPLEYAQYLYQATDTEFRHADPQRVEKLLSVRKMCIVRGGAKAGRAPYVEFYRARYSNEMLQNRHDLVGSKIWVICHKEDDCRIALASTLEGISLGVLRAAPPWNSSPHSLAVRAAICQASLHGRLMLSTGCDAIEVFIQFAESQTRGKLPIHPAYLEARRILTSAAEQSIGTTMLESAKAHAASNHTSPQGSSNPTANENTLHSLASQQLPPRRSATSR